MENGISPSQELSARLFWSGHSQALRLPKEFRLDGDEVKLVRLGAGILITPVQKRKKKTAAWDDYFSEKPETEGFMESRPLNMPHQKRKIF